VLEGWCRLGGPRVGKEIGQPIGAKNVVCRFKRILRQAGLPDIRFYDLRHTCASLLLAQRVHPRVVREILGHSQIGLTMNTYSDVISQLQHEAASNMDDLLNGASNTLR
jgi:integrase